MLIIKGVLVIAASYLIGSIPWGLIVGKVGFKIDIRTEGSGNIGTTNIFRILGPFAGAIVLLGDVLKGVFVVWLGKAVFTDFATSAIQASFLLTTSIAVIIGHNWSIYLKFTGGKGIATSLGVLLMLFPVTTLFLFVVWLLVVGITRYVSLGSIIIAILFPVLVILFYWGNYPYIAFSLVTSIMVILRHRSNIQRLLQGKELRFGRS